MLRKILPLLLAIALSSGITYVICSSQYEQSIAELSDQVKSLQNKEQEAKVIQRVSEQMEDIAFQQKSISDKQRERAEEQSRIAEIERGKAESERAIALKAQKKAVSAAEEADRMRSIAEDQSELATQNMIAAQEARAHADSLFYLSLARSLAQTSIGESNDGSTDLSRLLAYTAGAFTQENGGDLYQQNVFQALLKASNTTTNKTVVKGNARRIRQHTLGQRIILYGASDYGELVEYEDGDALIKQYSNNFRDCVVLSQHVIVALDLNGVLVLEDFATNKSNTAQLPADRWKRLELSPDGNMLIAMGNHTLAWIDAQTLRPIASQHFEQELTEIGYENEQLHLFANNNGHYIETATGKMEAGKLGGSADLVVAYFFDKQNKMHILGTQDGKIVLLSQEGTMLRTLTGHGGPITQVETLDNLLISSSYDHTLRFWNITDMSAIITPYEMTFEKWPLTFCILPSVKFIAVGQENGYVEKFCVSANYNMLLTRKALSRDFTEQEWNYYIGSGVPYRKFTEDKK